MNDSQTERSPLWDNLRQEADQESGFSFNLDQANLATQPVTLVDKFKRGWQGGIVPLFLAVCSLVLIRGMFNTSPYVDRWSWSLIGVIWIVSMPVLNWLLGPLLRDSQGVRPGRLLAFSVGMAWYLPATTAIVFLAAEARGLVSWGRFSDPWVYLSLARTFDRLLLYIGLMMLIYPLARWIRVNTPWFDQRPPSRDRTRLALWAIGLPPLIYLACAIWALPGSKVLDWEREVRGAQPEVVNWDEFSQSDGGWASLSKRPLAANGKAQILLRQCEQEALDLGMTGDRWSWSSQSHAERTLEGLLEHHSSLRDPVGVMCLYFEVSSLDGGYFTRVAFLREVLLPLVLEGKASDEVLESTRSGLLELLEQLPSRVDELDRRIYLRSSSTRTMSTPGKLLAWLISPPTLQASLDYERVVGAWTLLRSEVERGASWDELQNSADSQVAKAARTLEDINCDHNKQDTLKPALETWILLTEIRLWEREHGFYPPSLEVFELYRSHPGRWSWQQTEKRLGETGQPDSWGFR